MLLISRQTPLSILLLTTLASTEFASASKERATSRKGSRTPEYKKKKGSRNTGGSKKGNKVSKKHVIFSTDCSGGLFGPNAGYDECPAAMDDVNYRDIDDLMAITLAINNGVEIDAIVPTFGDASMPSNLLTGTQLVHTIKGRDDIPIVPGAVSAAQPVFIDTWRIISDMDETGWGGPLPLAEIQKLSAPRGSGGTIDPVKLFQMSCKNQGVETMEKKIDEALKGDYTIDMLGIGPMTDFACLLLNIEENKMIAIEKLVLLIGQEAGVPFGSGDATGRDFNMVLDPLGAAIVLSFSEQIPIVLMEFVLTGSTSGNSDLALLFSNDTFLPDTLLIITQAKISARPGEDPLINIQSPTAYIQSGFSVPLIQLM
jgi:inosine-uridine nucleoside N-ribohydrolase